MKATPLPLLVGLPGTELHRSELALLETVRPRGVILFARNIEAPSQVRLLVDALDELEPVPFVAIDLEGGAVNRLQQLWGDLPSPAEAAFRGRKAVRALGEAAGAACRALGIHLDLAPVVDLQCPDGAVGLQGRCLGSEVERVTTFATLFHEGLSAWGVAGCLKHFPGLGAIAQDTHEQLPTLDLQQGTVEAHLEAFAALSELVPAVMMAHVIVPALGDEERPASLSATIVERAASLPGSPVVLSDDLEMGALAGLGDLPALAVTALRARNHGVLVCSAFDRLDEVSDHLRSEAEHDSLLRGRLDDNAVRLGTLSRDLNRRFAAVPAPDDDAVAQLWEQARRAAEG
jgi:beta-N-acetylhexosaminidase